MLVEKPIDVTLAKGRALVAAAERAGVRLGVLFQDRLKPELVRLREFVAQGGLGRVLLASARVKWHRPPEYYAASNWRGRRALDGGAALINQGVHTVDLLLWLLGDVTRVKALHGHDAPRDRERGRGAGAPRVRLGRLRDPRGDDGRLARLPAPRRDLRDGGDRRRGRRPRHGRRPAPPGARARVDAEPKAP